MNELVYMAHPLSAPDRAGLDRNLARAIRWYDYFTRHFDVSIVANWILTCMVLDDHNPEHRARGIAGNLRVLERCDRIFLCGGRVTTGMHAEARIVDALGKPIESFLHLGEEPPDRLVAGERVTLSSLVVAK